MSKLTLRIKEAIIRYNKNLKEGAQKMDQRSLGDKLFPEESQSYRDYLMSQLAAGKNMKRFTPETIKKICALLNVDANFLYGIKPMKKDE